MLPTYPKEWDLPAMWSTTYQRSYNLRKVTSSIYLNIIKHYTTYKRSQNITQYYVNINPLKINLRLGMMVYTFNLRSWEAEASTSLVSLRPASST